MKSTIVSFIIAACCICQVLRGASDLTLINMRDSLTLETQERDSAQKAFETLSRDIQNVLKKTVTDDRILEAMAYRRNLNDLERKLVDANLRQALLAENIAAVVKSGESSDQERLEYQRGKMTLQSLAHTQNDLIASLGKLRKRLDGYFVQLPPPSAFELPNGLTMTLVRAEGLQFYVSQVVPLRTITKNPEDKGFATFNYFETVDAVKALSEELGIAFSLPLQEQLEAMAVANVIPEIAIWSREVFSIRKRALALERKRRQRQKNPNLPELPRKTTLTPSQQEATARFKPAFYMIWDAPRMLDEDTFARELPNATYPELGFVVIAHVKEGSSRRMEAIQKRFEQLPQQPQGETAK